MIYIRESDAIISPPFMSDGAYQEARQALPFVTTDAIIYDPTERVIYLAWRQSTPAQGWWAIGGGVKNGQSPDAAMVANFKRETSLELPAGRFTFLAEALNMTQWIKQEQISNVHLPYGVQLGAHELAVVQANLESKEYSVAHGMQKFDLSALLQAITDGSGYPQPVLYYDALFSTSAFPEALVHWRKQRD